MHKNMMDEDMGFQDKIAMVFSKNIKKVLLGLFLVIISCTIFCIILDTFENIKCIELQKVKEICGTQNINFISEAICIWGFTLSSVIFLIGRLEEIYYGTSLKRIIILCFGKVVCIFYIITYVGILPALVISDYLGWYLLNGWMHVLNYFFSVAFIIFMLFVSLRSVVIELIRNETIKQLNEDKLYKKAYEDEKLPILNMIRNVDYDDMWQTDRLKSIIMDMIEKIQEKEKYYILYNVIFWIVRTSGYKNSEQRTRTINILGNIMSTFEENNRGNLNREKIVPIFVGIISPLLQVDVEKYNGKWIKYLLGIIPASMRIKTIIILLFNAEYLCICGVYYETVIDELLNAYLEIEAMEGNLYSDEESLEFELYNYWLTWTRFDNQKSLSLNSFRQFVEDYVKIEKRICTTKILFELQMRKWDYECY